jgi:hypothetical protein
LPRAVARGVGAAAAVVVGEGNVGADMLEHGTRGNNDCDHTDGSFCDLRGMRACRIRGAPDFRAESRLNGRGGDGWLAEPKLVRRRQARLRVAKRRYGAASFACNQRRMVDQNSVSWNRIAGWLRQLDLVRSAA